MRAFRSEWIKLTRRNMLLGFGGAMVGFTLLFTVMVFINVGGTDVGLDEGGEAFVTEAVLAASDGSVFAITQVAPFLGIIALALFASNIAGEFNRGTIRMLFVTEPSRLVVVAGKLAALATFVAVWVAVTLAASIAVAASLAPQAGVDISAWWTADGLSAVGAASLNITAAILVPGLIGATLAVLTRSAAIAISVGVAYFILAEALIAAFWEPLGEWGPSAVSNVLATGGAAGMSLGAMRPGIGFATAALVAIGYGLVSVAISSTVIATRDVTS